MFSSKEALPVPAQSSPPSPTAKYRVRRRRSLLAFLVIFVVGIVFFTPSSFWDITKGLGRASDLGGSSSENIIEVGDKGGHKQAHDDDMSDSANYPDSTAELSPTDELKLLLHMVASTELRIPKDVDPTKPLPRDVYDAGIGGGFGGGIAWLQAQQADPPVIVFSKTYCPYSTKAKETLKSFNLNPPEKVVEVDKRDDAEALKVILTRLTERSTFPNIFIKGQSIGGSDDLQELIAKDQFVSLLADAGVNFVQESN